MNRPALFSSCCLGLLLLRVALPVHAATPGQGQPPSPPSPPEAGLDDLAALPGRPAWGALPVLRGQQAYLPVARQALHSPKALERQRATFVLALLELPESRPSLRFLLHDADRAVRQLAGVALCLQGDAGGLAAARQALLTAEPWQQYYALLGLWRVGGERVAGWLRADRAALSPFLQGCLDEALRKPYRTPWAQVVPQAVSLPENAEALWGDVADALIEETDWWWHKGNYDQSIRCQQASLFFDPQNVDAWGNIAWLQWSMGRDGEAIRTYRRCLQLNPLSWEAADQLAVYYRGHHQLEAAARYFGQAAKLGSPAIQRRQWGHVLELLGRNDEARSVWQQILQLDPNDPIAKRQLQRLDGK